MNQYITDVSVPITPLEIVENACSIGDDSQLIGVYTPPKDAADCQICVLYLTAGLLHHVGPTRLHVELARALSQQNFAGLRFDLSGVGDSETNSLGGYFTERSISEVRAVMDYVQKEYGHKHFVLFGLCSGADDALATASQDGRVVGTVLLNGYAYPTSKLPLYRFKEFYWPRICMVRKWKKKITNRLTQPHVQVSPEVANGQKGNSVQPAEAGRCSIQQRAGKVDNNELDEQEKAAIIALDDDYRYIPPQKETAQVIDTLTERGVNLFFIYSGSEYELYSYQGQLGDMFPKHRDNPLLHELYLKEADHTFILKEDRAKLVNWLQTLLSKTEFKCH